MRILASRLYEAEQEKRSSEFTAERRSQVGSGMRNERIRTYNFPQGRVTDHRIGLTLYKIESVMDGDLDEADGRPGRRRPGGAAEADPVNDDERIGRGPTWIFIFTIPPLPQGKSLADVVGELNEVLEDGGAVRRPDGRPRRTAGSGAGGREGEPQIRPDGGEGLSPAGPVSPGYPGGAGGHGDRGLQ